MKEPNIFLQVREHSDEELRSLLRELTEIGSHDAPKSVEQSGLLKELFEVSGSWLEQYNTVLSAIHAEVIRRFDVSGSLPDFDERNDVMHEICETGQEAGGMIIIDEAAIRLMWTYDSWLQKRIGLKGNEHNVPQVGAD
jgi:hypothetical protein